MKRLIRRQFLERLLPRGSFDLPVKTAYTV